LTEDKTSVEEYGQEYWLWTERIHSYDAVGRLVKSGYSQHYSDTMPNYAYTEHTYAGSRHVQNYDGSSTYGERWHWAG
jgi:hypothetical protein